MTPGFYKTESEVPLDWHVGDVILDAYEVKGINESGGMGKVYRCHSRDWNMDLAVKSPRANFFSTEQQKEDFTKECETWIQLGMHPHIVSCFFVRPLGGVPRVFAEFMEGGSLKEWIDTKQLYSGGKKTSLLRIIDFAIQIAFGLEYAHKQLIHQDVKPANILMTLDGVAKVSDFGISNARAGVEKNAHLADESKSILCSFGGRTPAYNSPEQAIGSPLTRRTDIYSWAVMVFEMFAGGVFWSDGRAAGEAFELYQNRELSIDSTLCPQMSLQVAQLIAQCLAYSEDLRPHDFAEVIAVLKDAYVVAAGSPYPRNAPSSIELDGDTLNNKALSLLGMGKLFKPSDQGAFSVFLDLERKHNDHYFGRINRVLCDWRELGEPIEKTNRAIDAIFDDPYGPDLIQWRIGFELEKLEVERARKLLINCLDMDSAEYARLATQITNTRNNTQNLFLSFFSAYPGKEEEKIEPRLLLSNVERRSQCAFAHRNTGVVIINNRPANKVIGYDWRNMKVLWEREFSCDHVAISENAVLVAQATLHHEEISIESKETPDRICSLTLISARTGNVISTHTKKLYTAEAEIVSITLDDKGSLISVWIRCRDGVFDFGYDLIDGKLMPFKIDLRKGAHFHENSREFKLNGSGTHLLCYRNATWSVRSPYNSNSYGCNTVNVDFSDFGLLKMKEYLPGFALDKAFEYAVDDLNSWDLLKLFSAYKPATAEYLICKPMHTDLLFAREERRKELQILIAQEKACGDIRNAILHMTESLSASSGDRDLILTERHELIRQSVNCTLTRVWRAKCLDEYWDNQIMGIVPATSAGLFAIQAYLSFRYVAVRRELELFDVNSSAVRTWGTEEFTVGVFRISVGQYIRLREPHGSNGILGKGCCIERVNLSQERGVVECLWSHGIFCNGSYDVSPLMTVVDDAVFFQGPEGVINVCDVSTGVIRRTISYEGKSVEFIKRIELTKGAAQAFVSLSPTGYLIIDAKGDSWRFSDFGLTEPELFRIDDVATCGTAVVGGCGEFETYYEDLRIGKQTLVWSVNEEPFESSWWRPRRLFLSPCGKVVAFMKGWILQFWDYQTGSIVFSWDTAGDSVIDMAFDSSGEWFALARSTNRVEFFRLFWSPDGAGNPEFNVDFIKTGGVK